MSLEGGEDALAELGGEGLDLLGDGVEGVADRVEQVAEEVANAVGVGSGEEGSDGEDHEELHLQKKQDACH